MNIGSKIKTPNFFISINKISSSARLLLTGMLLSLLWFIIYYFAKEYFLHPLYFVLPSLLIILVLIVLPKLASRGNANPIDNPTNPLEGVDTSNMQVEQVNLQEQAYNDQSITATTNQIDESLIQQLIDEKINSIAKEFSESKQQVNDALATVNNIKADVESLKKSLKELTEAFETTLVDFKAFQAEIANPLNFMRKYFDQLDIKNLSDPALPLQQSGIDVSNGNGNGNGSGNGKEVNVGRDSNGKGGKKSDDKGNYSREDINSNDNNSKNSKGHVNTSSNGNYDNSISNIIELAESNGITLSKLMELILTIGEFMKVFGSEYAKILDVQCRLLNLSKDAERIVYSIVDMLSRSTLTPEECIISLYRLAFVLGLNDSDADTIYARVKMSVKSEPARLDKVGGMDG